MTARVVIVSSRLERARDFAHSQGLLLSEVCFVIREDDLRGLMGLRKNPKGLVAIYEESWWDRPDVKRTLLLEMLRARGFNTP